MAQYAHRAVAWTAGLSFLVVIAEIFLNTFPIDVMLEDGPLDQSSPQCVPLGGDPPHDCGCDRHRDGMKPVKNAEYHKEKQRQSDEPEKTSARGCPPKPVALFK